MKRGCRGSRNSSKKRLKAGSFFSQILDILTTHETSKVHGNQRTCLRRDIRELKVPTCPTIPDTFVSASKYYSMHLQFTLHEASYLVRQKTVEVLNKHGFPLPVSSSVGDTNEQVSRKALNGLIKGFYCPKNSSSAGLSYGNSTKDHRKRVPSKVYLQFRVCGDRHRDFPDVSRSQSIVLIHCMNRIFLAACLGEEIIGSLLRYETCVCAYYFFESKRFDPKRNPVFIEPVTSIINLKRMNDVCLYAPSLGSYTNQILGWERRSGCIP